MARSSAADVLAFAGIDAQHVSNVDEQGHLDGRAGRQRGRLGAALGGITLEPRVGFGHLKLDEVRRRDGDRLVVPERHLADLLLLDPVLGVTHRARRRRRLLVAAVGAHEVPEVAVRVQVLHVELHDVRGFQAVARLERPLPNPTGDQIAKLDPIEGLALPRLHELVLEDRAGLALQKDLQSRAELVGRNSRHVQRTSVESAASYPLGRRGDSRLRSGAGASGLARIHALWSKRDPVHISSVGWLLGLATFRPHHEFLRGRPMPDVRVIRKKGKVG